MANPIRAKSFRPKSNSAKPQFAKSKQSGAGGYAVEPIDGGPSWLSQHKWAVIGVGGGVLLLLWLRSRSGSSGVLAPSPSSGSNSFMGGAPGGSIGAPVTDTSAGATTNPPAPSVTPNPIQAFTPDYSQYQHIGSGYISNAGVTGGVEQSISGGQFSHIANPTVLQQVLASGQQSYFEPQPGIYQVANGALSPLTPQFQKVA